MHVDEHMAKGIRQCVPRSLVVLHSNSFFFDLELFTDNTQPLK